MFFFWSWRWRGLILFCGWQGDAPPPMDRTLGSSHRDTIWVTWWHTSRNEYTGTLVWWRSIPHKACRSNGCTFHRGQSWRFVWLLNEQNVLVISSVFINHLYSNVGVPLFIIIPYIGKKKTSRNKSHTLPKASSPLPKKQNRKKLPTSPKPTVFSPKKKVANQLKTTVPSPNKKS